MPKTTANFTLRGDDARLIDKLKRSMKPKFGEISSVAVIRIALRALERTECKEEGDANAA